MFCTLILIAIRRAERLDNILPLTKHYPTSVDTKRCDRIEVRNLIYLASVTIGMMKKY